ncbi:MAG: TonB family protein [Bdellovibrio sp.]|nr:TonB family protein [Bdellovibrio sp.]
MGARELNKSHDDDFKRGFGISAVLHVLIVLFFIVKVAFYDEPILDLSQAIRVDMVGLPDKMDANKLPPKVEEILKEKLPTKEQPKVEEKKEEVVKEPVKEKAAVVKTPKVENDAVNLKKVQQKQKTAIDKLKKLDALEKIKQDIRNEAQKANVKPIKGRVIMPGSGLTGLDKLDANAYLQTLDQHVKQNWSLPQWLMNKPLKTQVHVRFDANGKILSRAVLRSSGEPAYDEQCLEAVDRSAPFPIVPEKFSEKFKVDGVVIGFPE